MEANQYLPTVAWRTDVKDVILLTEETITDPSTYRVTVFPIDVNEPGAVLEEKEIDFYLKDFVGHTYRVIAVAAGTIDVADDFRTGVGPQEGRKGIVYKSVGEGTSPYLAPVYYRGLDKSAADYSRRFELDILWRNINGGNDSYLRVNQTVPQAVYGGSPIVEGFQFDTTPTTTNVAEGLLRWNPTDRTLDLGLMGGLSTMQIGQELSLPAFNDTGVAIPEGIPVYVSGRHGHLPKITPARSDTAATSTIFGITTTTFGTTGDTRNGLVTVFGYVRQLKTNYTGTGIWGTTWVTNDKLYVSKTVVGQLTNVEPSAPHHSDIVATVAIVGAVGIGSLLVINQKHTTLEELTDVNGTPLTADGQFPNWNNTTKYFDFDKNINNYLLKAGVELSKQLSGFIYGDTINVSYSHTNRTITLTGDLTYLWHGEVKTLVSPWTSVAHSNMAGQWFLSSNDGVNFVWVMTTAWLFEYIQVAVVRYNTLATDSFAVRETHGIMDFESHEEFHSQIGTYRVSGGLATAGTYAVNTATDAAVTPGFDAAVIKDEDCTTTIPAWTQGTYTTLYIGAGNTATFSTIQTRPFHAGAGEYLYINNTTTGAFVPGINSRFYNVYQVLIPATSDVDSQKYRMVMLQPQFAYTSQAAAQSEDVRILSFGNISASSAEFVLYTRITYSTLAGNLNVGKCTIPTNGISYVIGSRAGQVSVTGFTTNNHQTLSNLTWSTSGHIGTASKLAGFGVSGEAVDVDIPTSSFPDTITGDTINADDGNLHTHELGTVGSEKIVDGAPIEYGNIYNGYTANGTGVSSIATVGWSIVSNTQLLVIQSNLGGSAVAGGKMKEAGLTHWNTPNTGADNSSGFNGRGNGYRAGSTGTFYALKEKWSIWTATIDGIKHYLSQLNYNTLDFHVAATWSENEKNGHAIRLAKDTTTLADGETGIYIGTDNKVYPTKCYGTVEIMTCNLAETLLRDGTPITKASLDAEWTALTVPGYCSYNNDDAFVGGQTQLSAVVVDLQNQIDDIVVITDHAALNNLVWTISGHTGTANRLASFGASGEAAYIDPSTYEVPLTFSTGLSRIGNTVTSTITQYTDVMADARVVAGITGKQNTITTGTTLQYFRGDLSLETFPTSLPASDVYTWAKQPTKPTYTYTEVGAQPAGSYDNYQSWGISVNGGLSSAVIGSGNIVNIYGSGGVTTSRSGNDITITGSGTGTNTTVKAFGYTALTGDVVIKQSTNVSITQLGQEISIAASETSHADVVVDGDFVSQGIMLRGAASGTYSILTDNSTAWNSAASASHGYLSLGTSQNGLSLNVPSQILEMGLSSSTAAGSLSSTDWSAFNGKQAALNGTGFVKASGTTISYDNSSYALLNGNVAQNFSANAIVLPSSYSMEISGGDWGVWNGSVWVVKANSSTVTGYNFTLASDRRLKQNISPIFTDSQGIEFVNYTMISDETDRKRIGVIAQDVEEIIPEIVYTDDLGIKAVDYTSLLLLKILELEKRIKILEDGN